ncbi:MAG TPA: IS1595 family transposase [Terriglobales bacterium]|nr:IS1595 family transposase [Terriglobales bacterium]
MNTANSQKLMAGAEQCGTAQERIAALGDATRDLIRDFPNEDACLEFIKEKRWPQGITRCAKCGVDRRHHRVSGRKAYACDRCGTHLYPLRGTVFARSSTSLLKWFHAVWQLALAERRVTAKQIQRETGVTYKTAWRMLHRLRSAGAPNERMPVRLLEAIVSAPAGAGAQGGSASAHSPRRAFTRHES